MPRCLARLHSPIPTICRRLCSYSTPLTAIFPDRKPFVAQDEILKAAPFYASWPSNIVVHGGDAFSDSVHGEAINTGLRRQGGEACPSQTEELCAKVGQSPDHAESLSDYFRRT